MAADADLTANAPAGDRPAVVAGDSVRPDVALAVYAHPDDPEVAAGGTLALWAAQGCEVHICVCAAGDKGSVDPGSDPRSLAQQRRGETIEAGAVIGVDQHHFLDIPDGEISDDSATLGRVVELIRRVRPEVVLAPDPTAVFFGGTYVNHRDHRQVGWLALDAVAPAAANPHYFPAAGEPHQVSELLLSGSLEPDFWVDISEVVDLKAKAIACHSSQVGEATEWLAAFVERRAEEAGAVAGVDRAEGFRRVRLA